MNRIKNTISKIALIYIVLYFQTCSPSPDNSQDPNGGGLLTNLFMTNAGIEFKNQAVTSITGILYDTTGEPLANAILDLSTSSTREVGPTPKIASESTTTTDSDGVFYLKVKLGNFNINVTKADGTKMGSFTMDVSDTITPPKVGNAPNFGITGVGIAPIASKPPSVTESQLESLSYSSASFNLGLGIGTTLPAKLSGGKPTSCTASPSLPVGLFLSNTSCRITGIPTTVQASTAYTITASNLKGSVTGVLNLTVVVLPPTNLTYGVSTLTLVKDTAMSNISPLAGGSPITSFSVSPSLPSGLSLNTTIGIISGTPTTAQSNTSYTITATNSAGSTTINLSIGVFSVYVSMPTGLLKTGQTTSYVTGDDGTYQKGIARNFVSGGSTGLIWQRCSAGQNNDATCSGTAQGYTWDQANNYCNSLTLAGKTWRMPTINELKSLVDYGKSTSPTIDITVFPNTQPNGYWSSGTVPYDTGSAWLIVFSNGSLGKMGKTGISYVRCTSELSTSQATFTDNGNGTVTDSTTGLVWQKCTAGLGNGQGNCSTGNAAIYSWSNAISYCEELTLGGRIDWRLPNTNELGRIVDYTISSTPKIDTFSFPNTQSSGYWTSSTFTQEITNAWNINFVYGYVLTYSKSNGSYVRCVAGP